MTSPMPTPSEPIILPLSVLAHKGGFALEHIYKCGLDNAHPFEHRTGYENRQHIFFQEPRYRTRVVEAIDISRDDIAAGLLCSWGHDALDAGIKDLFADRIEELGHMDAAERVRRFDCGELRKWAYSREVAPQYSDRDYIRWLVPDQWRDNLATLFGHVWCQRCKKPAHTSRFNDIPSNQSWMFCNDCIKEARELRKVKMPPMLMGMPVKIDPTL
jgi:hypothetical protein